jgi:peptidoglycan/LPS O-acetylase OafA/YrhL
VFVLSLGIFILAQLQIVNIDHYGYRLMPGVLFIFIIGVFQDQAYQEPVIRNLLYTLWLINFGYLTWLLCAAQPVPFNREVALGIFIGMPLLVLLNQPILNKKLDKHLGELSYGVFLYHFPVVWLLKLQLPVVLLKDGIAVVVGSLCAAYIGHWLIERPLWKLFRSTVVFARP